MQLKLLADRLIFFFFFFFFLREKKVNLFYSRDVSDDISDDGGDVAAGEARLALNIRCLCWVVVAEGWAQHLGRAHTESTRHESTRSPPPLYPM